jgi:Right handed beta helix region
MRIRRTLGREAILTNSSVHDNPWGGLWCDFCTYGLFDVENNRIFHNRSNGMQWEMSGGWTLTDRAIVSGNIFHRNNYRSEPGAGGLTLSTTNDIVVSRNTFGGKP